MRDADKYLIAAARAGVVLSCVTQAHRLGLWTLDPALPHVAAPRHSGAVRIQESEDATLEHPARKAVVHWSKPLISRPPGSLLDPIENVLQLVAHCQPYESALAAWESALRQQRVDALAIARLPLTAMARELLTSASPFSDSGLETFVVPRLSWMKLRIVPQAWLCGHRVDFLIGDRLVLEIDGGQIVGDWPSVQHVIMRAVAQGLHRAA